MAFKVEAPDTKNIRVLLIDDDREFLDLARFLLEREGDIYVVTTASSRDALERLEVESYDCVISDFMMPEVDGVELLKILRAKGSEMPFILLTGKGREDVAVRALNLGADFYVEKGTDPKAHFAELTNAIRQSVSKSRAIQSFRKGDYFLSKIFTSIQDGLCILDRDLTIRMVNPTVEAWYADKRPLVGKKCSEVFPVAGDSTESKTCPAKDAMTTGSPSKSVISRRDSDGNVLGWIEVYAFPMTSEDGTRVDGVIEYLKDVTDQLSAESQLMQEFTAQEAFAALSKELIASPGGVERQSALILDYAKKMTGSAHGYASPIDPEKKCVISHTITEMFGKDCRLGDESKGIVFPIGEDGRYPRLWGESLNTCEAFFTNCPKEHKSYVGTPEGHVEIENFLSAPVMLGGEVLGQISLANSSRDYSERDLDIVKRLATLYALAIQHERDLQSLSDLDQRFKSFMDNTPAVAYMKNLDGRYVHVNRAYEKLIGMSEADMLGRTDHDLWPTEIADSFRETDKRVMSTGRPFNVTETIVASGNERQYISFKFPIFDPNGSPILMGGVSVDVTDLRSYEKALKVANDKLKMLGDLTRHDALNQLTALEGWLSLMDDAADVDSMRSYVPKARKSVRNLRNQLEFAVEYEQLGENEPGWIDMEAECEDLLRTLDLGEVEVVCDIKGFEIFADPMFVKVFHNLFENALKHGKKVARIEVGAEESGETLLVTVQDDGEGIPGEDKERIFDKGFGNNTGLGLYMIRELVRYGGMSIQETGEHGKGARFVIEVPRPLYRRVRDKT